MRLISTCLGIFVVVALLNGVMTAPPVAADTSTATLEASADETAVPAPADKDKDEPKAKAKKHSTRGKWDKKAADKDKSKPKYKPWKEVLKDAEKHEGLLNLYTKDEDLFLEIKEDQFDKPMVNFMNISQGIGTGWVLGGMPLGILETVMFDLHRVEDHIQFRRLNPRFESGGDEALEVAIDLTYGNSILSSLPIASENKKEKSVLVKVNSFFLSDVSDIGDWLRMSLNRPVKMDKKKAVFGIVKGFPENVEIEALLTFSPMNRRGLRLPQVPDSRYIEVGVRYSIRMLPEEPMKPRIADDRVGYFMSPHKDFSRDASENFMVHYINRWRMEKKDPTAALSEPKKPIIYYLDKTIPEKYHAYVTRGVEMWQRAFEEAGFKNAIYTKLPGDDPEYNAEDARFNTIRWIVSDQPSFGAIGPHRTDPRTGEILESDILMEQSMIAGYRRGYRRYAGPEAFLQHDPMLMFLRDPKSDPEVANYMELWQRSGIGCTIGYGFASGFELMQIAMLMDGTGMEVPEEYVGEAIARVTAHEVGHGLGLRHNFRSSTAVPFEKLNDRAAIEDIGLTGSVMDYATPNISRDRSKQGYYWTPTVGTWDRWVIRWGYGEVAGDLTSEEEQVKLRKIANEASEKRHTYGTDEDTFAAGALDPACMIWDLSDQPLKWAEERIGVCQDILTSEHLVDRVVRKGDNFVPLRNAVVTLLVQEYRAGSRAVRYIGGQHTARPHLGDGSDKLPLSPVSKETQEEAMGFLVKHVFSENAFAVSPELLDKLQPDKMRHWQNNPYTFGRRFDFPLTLWVAGLRNATLFQLLHPMRLQRMEDAAYKQDEPYRISDVLSALTGEIWTGNMVPAGKTAAMQRDLQRIYLGYLARMVVDHGSTTGAPSEARALARLHLTRIGAGIDRANQRSGLSDEANAHLIETRARIDRTLDAEMESSF